jgi:glycosyltransferase involved in cell wall biosynthesis
VNEIVQKGRKVLLAVGRLGEEKRFDRVIDAFAKLADRYPGWDLVILGEGSQRAALEVQRNKLGLDARIHLPGRVGNLADWYRRASLYVMSSRFEGFPNSLLEALAYGVPSVAVDCETGPRDILRSEVDGLLVPQNDHSALVAALDRMISNDKERASYSKRAIEVRDRFLTERVASLWEQIIEQAKQ